MTATLRTPRSRGALGGVLLVLLGIWGALIPFIGPYFHYAYTPNTTWDYTSGRLWLEVLPGAATLFGGLLVLISKLRPVAMFGALVAALAGVWFAVGGLVAHAWARLPGTGTPVGGATRTVLEQLGFFTGLGVLIAFVAAGVLGRFTVVGVRDVAAAARATAADDSTAATPVTAPSAKPVRTSSNPLRRLALSSPVVKGRRTKDSDSAAADEAAAERESASTSSS
jgi:hypothetical protein